MLNQLFLIQHQGVHRRHHGRPLVNETNNQKRKEGGRLLSLSSWKKKYWSKNWSIYTEENIALQGFFEVKTSSMPGLKKIIWVIGVLRRTVVCNLHFNNPCWSHLQSQVIVLVSWKFKHPGEQFDWSIDGVAVGKCVMWLAVKTCVEI